MEDKLTEIPEELRIKLGKYINKLKDKQNLGFNQLSVKSGINPAALNRILNGTSKKINPYLLMKLASSLRIDYKELYKIVGYLDEEETIEPSNIASRTPLEEAKIIEIPVYGQASAGKGRVNMGNIIRYEKLTIYPGEDIPKNAFGVEVSGDSMYPSLLDGDLAIIDPDCQDINLNGEICVITYEGEEYIKRIQFTDRFVTLMSDNPDRESFKDIIVLKDEFSDFRCHGILIESRRKHRKKKKG